MGIRLLSVNIEGQKHLARVRDLIARERPEVVCLQEVFEDSLAGLGRKYRYRVFGQVLWGDQDNNDFIEGGRKIGVAILSRTPLSKSFVKHYGEARSGYQQFVKGGGDKRVMVGGEIELKGARYQLATTHFTWTPDASVDERQRLHLKELLHYLEGKELVLAGDFNTPRGSEVYRKLASRFQDNVPVKIETTLDPKLHYANREQEGRLRLVVDYVWSTRQYQVSPVRVVEGVSDHCALIAQVDRV